MISVLGYLFSVLRFFSIYIHMIISTSASFYLILFYIITLVINLFSSLYILFQILSKWKLIILVTWFFYLLKIFLCCFKITQKLPLQVLWSNPQINFHHHHHHDRSIFVSSVNCSHSICVNTHSLCPASRDTEYSWLWPLSRTQATCLHTEFHRVEFTTGILFFPNFSSNLS
mgnify:CR=1 FL=1